MAAIFGPVFMRQAALLIFLSLRNADRRFTARRDVRSVARLAGSGLTRHGETNFVA
jgi:hypothetical protein